MDWLPVASIVGLIISVLTLGCAVIVLAARNKGERRSSASEQTRQSDALRDSSIDAVETGLPLRVPRLGFRNPRQIFKRSVHERKRSIRCCGPTGSGRVLGIESPEYLLCAGGNRSWPK